MKLAKLDAYFQNGTSPNNSSGINKRVILNNYLLSLIPVLHCLSYLTGAADGLIFLFVLIAYNIIALYLNQTGFQKVARVLTVAHVILLPLYLTQYYGRDGGILIILTTTTPLCFALFDLKTEKLLIFMSFIFTAGAGILLELSTYDLGVFENEKLPLEAQYLNYLPTFLICTIGSFYTIFWLSKQNIIVEDQLASAVQSAQEGEKSKAAFLSTMSHEIRTPLNAILGLSDLLRKDEEGVKEKADVLYQASQNLKILVDDILDYSKIEAGEMRINLVSTNLDEITGPLSSFYTPLAAKKDLHFDIIIDKHVPPVFTADFNRILQVLHNLLNNAVKFTSQGQITLTISFSQTDINPEIIFAVRDTGIGIDKKNFKSIFNYFQQVENKSTRSFEGTGLGLAICKHLVNLQEGKINVESVLGKGSVFSFHIPYTPAIDQIKETQKIDQPVMATNILYVEDNEINRFVTTKIFDQHGFDYTSFDTSSDALTASQKEKFDIIISDYHMSGLDGVELAKRIRIQQNNPNKQTPILILTADVFLTESNLAQHNYIDGIAQKPIRPKELLIEIQKLIPSNSQKV